MPSVAQFLPTCLGRGLEGTPVSQFVDLLPFFRKYKSTFAGSHGVVTAENSAWESSDRSRRQSGKIVHSMHGVSCTGSCCWKIYYPLRRGYIWPCGGKRTKPLRREALRDVRPSTVRPTAIHASKWPREQPQVRGCSREHPDLGPSQGYMGRLQPPQRRRLHVRLGGRITPRPA